MIVKQLMSRNPIIVTPNTPFKKVWTLIFEKRVSGLPVVNEKQHILGIISEEDLIEKLYPSYADYFFDPLYSRDFEAMEDSIEDVSHLKAKDFMNRDVYTTSEDTPIMKAASAMLIYKVSCLPVVIKALKGKKLVGIICKGDIFSQLFVKNIGKKAAK